MTARNKINTAKTKQAAAITGDVVASSRLAVNKRRKLQKIITAFAEKTAAQYRDFHLQMYRGDSLQALLTTNRKTALYLALQLQIILIMNSFHIRLSIGTGDISYKGKDVTTSDGTALQLSGTTLDDLKKRNEMIAVVSNEPGFNAEWAVHCASLNYLLQRLTAPQAAALYWLLQNKKQDEIAKTLKISQPSVHQRLQAAGANIFQKIIQRFEAVMQQQ